MGRHERPVDPSAGPVQRFAFELRKLRANIGNPTYRVMAGMVSFSAPALSEAAGGERFPSLAVTLAYVAACGGDRAEWESRWREIAQELADQVVEDDDTIPPYRGLARFEPDDARWFFGRDDLIAELTALVAQTRFVSLVGASGSGKSSLLRAGLIARLRTEQLLPEPVAAIRVVTPGEHPVRHAALFDPVDGAGDTIVVVDQFEELFTLCANPEERARFVDLLLSARGAESRVRVVVSVRADFYGHCAEHAELAAAMGQAHLLVGPMNAREVREAIVKPAMAAGLIVERSLTARLTEEIVAEPAALPLLSHVLLETWRRRRARSLTLEGYESAGGFRGALAKTAEGVFTELTPAQTQHARRVFLRLVVPGEGVPDTARPAERQAFLGTRPDDTEVVLERLARARLITLDDTTVSLTHEALMRAWPRLRQWIDESRETLRLHHRLTEAAHAWEELHRDPDALYRGTRLTRVRTWARDGLNRVERAFLEASIERADTEASAVARNHQRLRLLTTGLTIALVIAVAVSVVWLNQRQDAIRDRQTATSRQLAAQALSLLDSRPSTAKLLSIEAYRTAPTTEARGALLTMSARQAYRTELTGHTDAISEVAFSPDGRNMASVDEDSELILWDLRYGEHATIFGTMSWLRAVCFSPDGRLLAAGGDDQAIVLWDTDTRQSVAQAFGHAQRVNDLAFSPDGRTLASASADHTTILWDLTHRVPRGNGTPQVGLTPRVHLTGHQGLVQTVAFEPHGALLATGSTDGTIKLWNPRTGALLATLSGHQGSVDGIAFSPNGRTLASASPDGTVRLWDTARHTALATLRGHTDEVRAVAFSPDGQNLVSAGHDRTVILWDVPRRTLLARLAGHTNYVHTLAFNPRDPHLLASAGEDGRIILWDPTKTPLAGHAGAVNAIAYSPDGRVLGSAGQDHTVVLWNTRTNTPYATTPTQPGPVNTLAFSPDGKTLATAGGSPNQATDQHLALWDIHDPNRPRKIAELPGHTEAVQAVAFSPDGRTLASVGTDGKVIFWDTRRRHETAVGIGGGTGNHLAFSPDGRTLAMTTGHQHTIVLWNVADATHEAPLTTTGTPRGVVFSPDGRTLITPNSDLTIAVWDTHRHTRLRTLAYDDTATNIAIAPDGTIATGTVEHTTGLWNPQTGTRLATLTGPDGPVTAVAFSPDGRTVAGASTDGTITLWHPNSQQVMDDICRTLDRNLTDNEWHQFLPQQPYRQTCVH